jgi:hypothetical protein
LLARTTTREKTCNNFFDQTGWVSFLLVSWIHGPEQTHGKLGGIQQPFCPPPNEVKKGACLQKEARHANVRHRAYPKIDDLKRKKTVKWGK